MQPHAPQTQAPPHRKRSLALGAVAVSALLSFIYLKKIEKDFSCFRLLSSLSQPFGFLIEGEELQTAQAPRKCTQKQGWVRELTGERRAFRFDALELTPHPLSLIAPWLFQNRAELLLKCGPGFIRFAVRSSAGEGLHSSEITWTGEKLTEHCLPFLDSFKLPQIGLSFSTQGNVRVLAEAPSAYIGEVEVSFQEFVLRSVREFRSSAGKLSLAFTPGRIQFKEPGQIGDPSASPTGSLRASLNGEVVFKSDPSGGLWNLRGRLALPEGAPLTALGLPDSLENARQDNGTYLIKVTGPFETPHLEPL
jgi:hypothetical protein